MAKLTYSGLEFHYFWRDPSLTSLSEYSLRLDSGFRDHYLTVGFSGTDFVRTFEPLLDHYDPHSNWDYRFDVAVNEYAERWKIKLWLTQISHFEGGVLRASAENPGEHLSFARQLIEREIASLVDISEFVEARGIRRLLGKDIAGTLVGDGVYVYLWQRLRRIPVLSNKSRWEPRSAYTCDFFAFADRMASAMLLHPKVVELCYGPDTDDLPAFIQRCDELLKSNLDRGELESLFKLIELSPTEWFAS